MRAQKKPAVPMDRGRDNRNWFKDRYFFSFELALASSVWLRKPSLSVSSLVNVSDGSESSDDLSEERLHQCFFSGLALPEPVAELSVLEPWMSEFAVLAEVVNSAREMRPS